MPTWPPKLRFASVVLIGVERAAEPGVDVPDPRGARIREVEIRIELSDVIVIVPGGVVLRGFLQREQLIAGVQRPARRRRRVDARIPGPEAGLLPRRRLQRRERGLRARRAVEPERIAERADALLRGPEVLLLRLKRGGKIDREGLVP